MHWTCGENLLYTGIFVCTLSSLVWGGEYGQQDDNEGTLYPVVLETQKSCKPWNDTIMKYNWDPMEMIP